MWFVALAGALALFLGVLTESQGAVWRTSRDAIPGRRGTATGCSLLERSYRGRAGIPSERARQRACGDLRVRLPVGWRVIRRRLTNVLYPVPALAVASFPVRVGRPCGCGQPNILDFPRTGAFLFVWEYTHAPKTRLFWRLPPLPHRFHIPRSGGQRYQCGSPSWPGGARAGDNTFQLEVYLGPEAGPKAITQMDALLASLRLA